MAQYLDKTGLTTLWTKIKNTFAPKSHTHKKSEITDLTIPTVNNPTITINQGGTKKGSFTLNQSGATTINLADNNTTYTAGTGLSLSNGAFSVKTGYTTSEKNYKVTTDSNGNLYVNVPWTDTNTNTWRPVVDNLTSTATDQSLSANQGKVLKGLVDGKAAASHTHSSVADIGNGATTTFAYSKAGMNYGDYTWLAGWNGYELRAVNKSQFATAGHTHSYLPLSGGTLTGSLTFKNSTWNLVGDDAYIGDYDQAGSLGIKGANGQTNIGFVNQSNNYYIKLASPGVTENRTITMPNDSGTMALTKNIPTSLPASNISMSSDGTTLTITYS